MRAEEGNSYISIGKVSLRDLVTHSLSIPHGGVRRLRKFVCPWLRSHLANETMRGGRRIGVEKVIFV